MRIDLTRIPSGKAAAALSLAAVVCVAGACSSVAGIHPAPTAASQVAPLSLPQAQRISARVMAQAQDAASAPAATAKQLRESALTGSALTVATAADQLGGVGGTPNPVTRTPQPRVLAISRGTGWPRVIVVETTDATGAAKLNLVTSPDARTPFRLSASATMHGGASVPALDSVTDGSPVNVDSSKLAVSPSDLLTEYAAALAYPKPRPAAHVDTSDPFSTGIGTNAAAQAKTFGSLANLTRTHKPQPRQTVSIALRGGGALVFALFERVDDITLKPGGKSLTPSAAFQKLVRKKTLDTSAELVSYETVVFTVPVSGRAMVVAADETLVSAKGA